MLRCHSTVCCRCIRAVMWQWVSITQFTGAALNHIITWCPMVRCSVPTRDYQVSLSEIAWEHCPLSQDGVPIQWISPWLALYFSTAMVQHLQDPCWYVWARSCNSLNTVVSSWSKNCIVLLRLCYNLIPVIGLWVLGGGRNRIRRHLPQWGIFRALYLWPRDRNCFSQPRGFREIWEFKILRFIPINVSIPDLWVPLFLIRALTLG